MCFVEFYSFVPNINNQLRKLRVSVGRMLQRFLILSLMQHFGFHTFLKTMFFVLLPVFVKVVIRNKNLFYLRAFKMINHIKERK